MRRGVLASAVGAAFVALAALFALPSAGPELASVGPVLGYRAVLRASECLGAGIAAARFGLTVVPFVLVAFGTSPDALLLVDWGLARPLVLAIVVGVRTVAKAKDLLRGADEASRSMGLSGRARYRASLLGALMLTVDWAVDATAFGGSRVRPVLRGSIRLAFALPFAGLGALYPPFAPFVVVPLATASGIAFASARPPQGGRGRT